jgi:hypothetical protein
VICRDVSWINCDHLFGFSVDRINWLRASARYQRWNEEVTLLRKEMSWTVLWFGNQRKVWEERLGKACVSQSEGHQAYACRQMHLWSRCIKHALDEFGEHLGGHGNR